ncbi:MAG TPA: hypothetical protein VK034_18130, partial [Enhygromyxa sp.]|nr:hypothetical protein [Enhygromyxa sp.]
MAWANVAAAEQPCGAPIERFQSCQVIEAPHCDDACDPGAMIVACVADNVDQCMNQCAGPESVSCAAVCEQQCDGTCAAALVGEQPKDCQVSCGASCMGECGAGCELSGDKTTCFAACGQQCDAHCELSCKAKPDVHDLD